MFGWRDSMRIISSCELPVPTMIRDFLASSSGVIPPLALAQALEGKSRPQIRKYRANFSTSFQLAAITDHKTLRKFTLGGARSDDGEVRPPKSATLRMVILKGDLRLDYFSGCSDQKLPPVLAM